MAKKSESGNAKKAHSPKQGRPQKPGREERPDKVRGHQPKLQEEKMARGNQEMADGINKMASGNKSKKGCAPKLFMLLLSFSAVGTYLFLRS